MKLKFALTFGLLSLNAFAATSFSGSGVTAPKNALGTANVTTGSLALLIVDIDNNGFLGMSGITPGAGLLASSFDPGLSSAQAALAAGQLFGGDKIVTVSTVGATGISNLLPSQDITAYLGKNFAVVWFDGLLTAGAPANAASGSKFGIIRGNDWTFPIADVAGALTFNSTDSGGATTLFQVSGATRAGSTTTGFASTVGAGTVAAASFSVVPEPSAALLGALGVFGLIRRRRN